MKALILVLATLLALQAQRDRPQQGALKVGDKAPDFTLKALNSDKEFKLSDNFGKRPTFLIFGSYT